MKKGFTLVELIIVIAIIGILAAVLLVGINPLEQINKGRDAGMLKNCKELIEAAERYYAFAEDDTDCAGLIDADELKDTFVCGDLVPGLSGSNGDYTCGFTPQSTTYINKCGGAVGETCIVPTEI